MNIFESNLEVDKNDVIKLSQSRGITMNWSKYVDLFLNYDGCAVHYDKNDTDGIGVIIPHNAKISELTYNDVRLSCVITRFNNTEIIRTSYNINK